MKAKRVSLKASSDISDSILSATVIAATITGKEHNACQEYIGTLDRRLMLSVDNALAISVGI